MKKLLLLTLLFNSIAIHAMEMESLLANLTLDETPQADIVQLWGKYNYALNCSNKDAKTIALLENQLRLLSSVDYQFMPSAFKHEWKKIIFDAKDNLIFNQHTLWNEKRNLQMQRVIGAMQTYAYPLNCHQLQLKTIAWAKKLILNNPWPLDWPQQLAIETCAKQTPQLSAEEIKNKRLTILLLKECKAIIKLDKARKSIPEVLPDVGTASIHGLRAILYEKTKYNIKENKDLIKTAHMYMHVLIHLDEVWLAPDIFQSIQGLLTNIAEPLWNKELFDQDYYRWQLAAIKWAEKQIMADACQNLSWLKSIFTAEKLREIEIPCPQTEELKQKRLDVLEVFKKETIELIHNYDKRKEIETKNKKQRSRDDHNCPVM